MGKPTYRYQSAQEEHEEHVSSDDYQYELNHAERISMEESGRMELDIDDSEQELNFN